MHSHFYTAGPLVRRIVGEDGLKRTYSSQGEYLLDGIAEYTGVTYEPNQRGVPEKKHGYRITANLDGKAVSYAVQLTEQEHSADFDAVLPTLIPSGVHVNAAKGLLQASAVAALEIPERIVEQTGSVRNDDTGLTVNARRYTNFPVEIVGERSDSVQGTIYRLRSKRTDGDALYFDVPINDMHMGNFGHRAGPNAINYLGVQTAMVLLDRWESTPENQRQRFAQEEYEQRRRQKEAELSREFRINGKNPGER
jgi:hypothetical protein